MIINIARDSIIEYGGSEEEGIVVNASRVTVTVADGRGELHTVTLIGGRDGIGVYADGRLFVRPHADNAIELVVGGF